MLTQNRYTWRHNSVLNKLFHTLKSHLPRTENIFCDLPGYMPGISTLPTDILVTSLKPDIVIVNKTEKTVSIIELTIPFDTNIENANQRKSAKYEPLISDIETEGYNVKFFALEISSRGFLSPDNSKRLSEIMSLTDYPKKNLNSLKLCLQKIAIVCSYCIFNSKYDPEWIEPNLVTF